MDSSGDWSYDVTMKTIAAAAFKAQCLALLDQVGPEGILITKRGRPVARLVPAALPTGKSLIGALKGKLKPRHRKDKLLGTGAWKNRRVEP
jgi:prevent-host-death family protein